MRLLVLYRPNSEHQSTIEAFVRDLERQHDLRNKIEMISIDTREGSDLAELYDVTDYPAILALGGDGSILNAWVGLPLPLMGDVAAQMYS